MLKDNNHIIKNISIERNNNDGSTCTEVVQYMSFANLKDAINTIKDIEINKNKGVWVSHNNGGWKRMECNSTRQNGSCLWYCSFVKQRITKKNHQW
jgi:hypothetical protein